jgi:hypothetical protein
VENPVSSLKKQNRIYLTVVLMANLAVFSAVVHGESLWKALRGESFELLKDLIPVGVAALVASLLNSQIPAEGKARIIFFRWVNPLPGCRAFSELATADPRIDMAALRTRSGPLPSDPIQQNALWYKLYRAVESEPSVRDAHQNFLFARDYAILSLLLLVALTPFAAVYAPASRPAVAFAAVLLAQFGLAARAARTHGQRLVCNVLAIQSAIGDPAR